MIPKISYVSHSNGANFFLLSLHITDVICKKSNSDNDDVNNDDINEKDVIERMEDDRDTTWNPLSTKVIKLAGKQVVLCFIFVIQAFFLYNSKKYKKKECG